MRTALPVCALSVLLAACNPIIPDDTVHLTSTQSYPLSDVVATAAVAAAVWIVVDPLAPNWDVSESKVTDNRWRIAMRKKNFTTGGDGEAIELMHRHAARLAELQGYRSYQIVTWTDPGPGGYYVDLSNAYDCPYLVDRLPYAEDPGFYRSPHRRFPYWKDQRPLRRAWRAYTGGLADFPFRLHFPLLDPNAAYKVRVVYSDTGEDVKVRLVAVDVQGKQEIEIHGFRLKLFPPQPLEFVIPREATSRGSLTLSLQREPGLGGLGAGHEISEIWIIKQA